MRHSRLAVVAVSGLTTLSSLSRAQTAYRVSTLPLPEGGDFGLASRIDNTGLVIGYANTSPGGDGKTILWQDQRPQLFPLSDNARFIPNGVSAGSVAGTLDQTDGTAAVWDQGNYVILPAVPGGSSSEARAINSHGDVVGAAALSQGTTQAVLWSNGIAYVLDSDPQHQSIGNSINDSGSIVGVTAFGDNSTHVTLWANGQARYLDEIPGSPSELQGRINNRGQIAVNMDFSGPGVSDDITLPYEWNNGTITLLQPLPNATSTLVGGLNDSGVAVGYSGAEAVEWINGVPTDLNSLIDPNSGWHLSVAADINDLGEITGHGDFNGEIWPFVLIPVSSGQSIVAAVPEPAALSLLCIGGAIFISRRSRCRRSLMVNGF